MEDSHSTKLELDKELIGNTNHNMAEISLSDVRSPPPSQEPMQNNGNMETWFASIARPAPR